MRHARSILSATLLVALLLAGSRVLVADATTRLVAGRCEVQVRIDGRQQWVEKPTEFCGVAPSPTPPPTATASPTATATATAVPLPTPTATAVPPVSPSPLPAAGSVVSPGQSIQAALDAAPDGGAVYLRAGTYREKVEALRPVTLAAYGDGDAWLDGACAGGDILTIRGSDVTVRGLKFKQSQGFSVIVRGGARATIDANHFQDYGCNPVWDSTYAAIGAWYTGPGHRVTGNTLIQRVEHPELSKTYGMYFKSNHTDAASGGGHYIAHNTIVGCWDGIGGAENFSPHGGFDGNTEIAWNDITGCDDDGIEAEGGTDGLWVHDNTIRESGGGVAAAGVHGTGAMVIERNRIESSTPGYYGSTLCFKLGASDATATLVIRDNWCRVGRGATDTFGGGQAIAQTNYGLPRLVISGNALVADRYVMELTSPIIPGTTADRDCMWTSDPSRFVKWGSARYTDLPSFQAATGQEANGTQSPACGQEGP